MKFKIGDPVMTVNGYGTVFEVEPAGVWVIIKAEDLITPEQSVIYVTQNGRREEKRTGGIIKLFALDLVQPLAKSEESVAV